MNATQQRQHKTKTDALSHVIADTQEAVLGRFEEVEASFAAMHDRFEALRVRVEDLARGPYDIRRDLYLSPLELSARLDAMYAKADEWNQAQRICCQERWDSQSATNKRLFAESHAFIGRGFWSRLNWLITGR